MSGENMRILIILSLLGFVPGPGEATSQNPEDRLKAAFDRAAKAADLDEAGLIISSACSDDSILRSAYLTSTALDERSRYILFGRQWGSRANITWEERERRERILIESVSAKPELIRWVLRADRYLTYREKRHPRGAATINSFPFHSYSSYADDLVETFLESARKNATRPAKAIKSINDVVLLTAEDVEWNRLASWQLLCGVCDRLDLIEKSNTKNWRERFADLDRWFHQNRPYILWDDDKSCIRLDEEAKENGRPTRRESRSIPELNPSWQSAREP
jgi:hypothetical protein